MTLQEIYEKCVKDLQTQKDKTDSYIKGKLAGINAAFTEINTQMKAVEDGSDKATSNNETNSGEAKNESVSD